ncbi:MAG: hypothetical protein WC683_02525 [bacterium]
MFYKHQAIQPTPGLAFEAFDRRYRNPMMPQQAYRPRAAGPEFLATDGTDHAYMTAFRSRNPVNLRGFGLDVNQLLGDQVGQVIDAAIERSWPKIQVKLNESLKPVMYMLGAAVLLSAAGATLSYLTYSKRA